MKHDKLPSTACTSCIQQINIWAAFKEKCIKSNEYLLNTIIEDVSTHTVNKNLNNIQAQYFNNIDYVVNEFYSEKDDTQAKTIYVCIY